MTEKEEHQLIELRYNNLKKVIDEKVDRLNQRRPDVEIPADEKGVK